VALFLRVFSCFLLQFLVDCNSINFICFTLQFPLHFLLSPYLLAHTAARRRKRDVKMAGVLVLGVGVERKKSHSKPQLSWGPNNKTAV